NSTTQNFTLNDRLQLIVQELKRGTEVLQKYDYNFGELDSGGILKNNGKLRQVESTVGANVQWTQNFTYDPVGRLSETSEYRGDSPRTLSYAQKFDYDRFGNLYRKQANEPTGQQTPIPFAPIEDADIDKTTNRLTTETVYDDAANVIQDTRSRFQNFFYD